MNNILEIDNICKKYDSFELKNVSFSLPRGYIMGFVGPNGAGKTTTIKAILGAVKTESGTIKTIDNNETGVVMDNPFYPQFARIKSVEEMVAPFYEDWDSISFKKYLKKFNLDKEKKIVDLSRGMKMKLQLAIAFSHNAKFLILDEPTSGLDVLARDEICDILREFVCDETRSVLFSTHITSDLEKTADYITFILNGGVIYTGTKDDFLDKYRRVSGDNRVNIPDIIGKRSYRNGFEGMILKEHIDKIPQDVLVENISLEEIIIFLSKGEINNE
ncbi:MAG: ABC transporter ATP-binding protein [Oscillospiraceae bacterium]|jgi:ABC-2 type transport system ATP-binding protein|nr:ABC transporter ATP-binding protein [Oscillospiraceae bacterium]